MALQTATLIDNDSLALHWRTLLDVDPSWTHDLGHEALAAIEDGWYESADGVVEWADLVDAAVEAKVSLPPEAPLPDHQPDPQATRVTVVNSSTLAAARERADAAVLALNMANGVAPGGGFLGGARAQEEYLCRSSALFATLRRDAMYDTHAARSDHESSDWAILSPDVPVFRDDHGTALPEPWLCSFLTCAAPYAPRVGQPRSGDLLARRAARVLEIARAYRYDTLILGAWGCGAFCNDPERLADDLYELLAGPYDGAFAEVVLAVTDWSPERRFLGPFRDRFCG